jgi:DNA polymerase III delta subunit
MSIKWKEHLSLVQCTTPEYLCDHYDNERIRRWVDKASEKLSKAIDQDLKDVHHVKHMDGERELLADCIDDGLRAIEDATHLLKTLQKELAR